MVGVLASREKEGGRRLIPLLRGKGGKRYQPAAGFLILRIGLKWSANQRGLQVCFTQKKAGAISSREHRLTFGSGSMTEELEEEDRSLADIPRCKEFQGGRDLEL